MTIIMTTATGSDAVAFGSDAMTELIDDPTWRRKNTTTYTFIYYPFTLVTIM